MIETTTLLRAQPPTLPRARPTDTPLRRELALAGRLRRLRAALLRGASRPLGLLEGKCC